MYKFVFKIMLIFALTSSVCPAQTNNAIFEKMVGSEVVMDTTFNAQFLQGRPNQRFAVDSDKDGRIDMIYLIDNQEKHQGKRVPLLVKVVDEDGDMYLTGEGDLDSDLYVADWYGDGTIDRVVDYLDKDGDNDMDEQYLYQWISEAYPYFTPRTYGGKAYCASFTRDYGDDNRLWYHTNYEYNQRLTQWLTDFNGDEMFVYTFYFDFEANTLTPACEIAFSFYDLDGDSLSEEAVRFEGAKLVAESLRYSMDIDNDTRAGNRHDYDFSITSLGPITLPDRNCTGLDMRGIKTDPVFIWSEMRQFAKKQKWGKTLLTWDENDNNIDPRPGSMPNERWEGILNHGSEFMPQVGGPSCGPYNKRNEIDRDRSGEFRFYYSPVDRRFHLLGAETGWINVDYDYDDIPDMVFLTEDTDQNGLFDTWKYDIDGDNDFERIYRVPCDTATIYPFDYKTLHEAYLPVLKKTIDDNRRLIMTLKAVLEKIGKKDTVDPVENYFNTELIEYGGNFRLGEKIKNSSEGKRYYYDLIRERYWCSFRDAASVPENANFLQIVEAYETGQFCKTARLLNEFYLPGGTEGR